METNHTSNETSCKGGCSSPSNCRCYENGYTRGKDKIHLELRETKQDHTPDCSCELCITTRAIIDERRVNATHQAAKWAATMVFHHGGYDSVKTRTAAGIDIEVIAAKCADQANGDTGKAAGTAVSAAVQMIKNLAAQDAGQADIFGLDPTSRHISSDGRYDGSA